MEFFNRIMVLTGDALKVLSKKMVVKDINKTEITSSIRDRDWTRGYVMPEMELPTDDRLMHELGQGLDTYRDVLEDGQVQAVFQQRRLSVISSEWQVHPASARRADKQAALFIEAELKRINFDDATDKMLWAVINGMAIAELMWDVGGDGLIHLDRILVRDYRRFFFDGEKRLRLRTSSAPLGEIMPDEKFWLLISGATNSDAPYGAGLNRLLYLPVFSKKHGQKFWLKFLEKYASPTIVGSLPAWDTAKANQLLETLSAVQSNSQIVKLEEQKIDMLEPKRNGSADYDLFLKEMNAWITRIILSQTATTDGTPGALGNDKARQNVAEAVIKADSDLVCQSFNASVVSWITKWNFPTATPPTVFRDLERQEDLTSRAERDIKIYSMGFVPSPDYIRETYGGDWQGNPPPVAQPSIQQMQPKQDTQAQTQLTEAPQRTEAPQTDLLRTKSKNVRGKTTDEIILSAKKSSKNNGPKAPMMIADKLSEEMEGRGIVGILKDALDASSSLEDFRYKLDEIFDSIPRDDRANMIAQALMVAELSGRLDVQNGN